jgi:nicotinamide mononucleotide (NMN) deamidase PncC
MDAAIRSLIEALHQAPWQYVLAVTGGGTGAAAQLLNVPGASRTVLEVAVPYHEAALSAFLGRPPEQFCSTATSQAMARRALERAGQLAPAAATAGVGCTASLVSDRPKRGDHRCHVTVCTESGWSTQSLTLSKGARDREGEEAVVDAVLLNALAETLGVGPRLDPGLLPGEEVQREQSASGPLAALFAGTLPALCVETDGRHHPTAPRPAVLLPGAFNPVHQGHWQLAEVAARRFGGPAAFELSILNVDKPPLPIAEVRRRLRQFTWRAPVWVTRAPTFAAKAALFPGTAFVVGADTAARIVAPRYYEQGATGMAAALALLREQGCRFLVAGRAEPSGRFVALDDLALPDDWRPLFTGLSAADYRLDLSSTQLREKHPHAQA